VLVLLCLLLGAALVRMKMVVGYLGERHAQLLVLCASFWATAAVAVLGDWLAVRWNRRWLSAALLTALIGFGLPVLAKPLHANQTGYRTAGLWLAAHAQPQDEIIDGHNSAAFYAGRLFLDEAAGRPEATHYAVVEEPQRSALTVDAERRLAEVVRHGTVVFRCPAESGRNKGPDVVVYAVRPTEK
jgi:hypothetical protein